MSFALSPTIDPNKIFLIQSSELEGRLDPFCYIPELVALDKILKSKTPYRLKDFSIYHAGGATPKKDNAENYATKEEGGVPFIRVQNLSITGELQLNDLAFIARETHEGLLKRSRLQAGDLLVKITGVGRMAVASVVPENFEGNINQHMVVIRTGSKEISENIAAYLNLDSVEKIASKRATGGTRPALDYKALLSIPVINDSNIKEKTQKAVLAKQRKEAEAQALLASIDDYLLSELGITLPPAPDNTTASRIFTRPLSDLTGGRFDPLYHAEQIFHFIEHGTFETEYLFKGVQYMQSGFASGKSDQGKEESGIIQIRPTNITNNREFSFEKNIYIPSNELQNRKNDILQYGEVLFNNTNSQILVGKSVWFDLKGDYFCSNHMTRIRVKAEKLNPQYLTHLLNLYQRKKVFFTICTNWNNQSGVNPEVLRQIKIPFPPLPKQQEIADHIKAMRAHAKQLQIEAKEGLDTAKREIEAMILG